MLDLEQALKLSDSAGRTGCRALCQRGLLRRKANDIEGARADFEKDAKMGSQFARSQVLYKIYNYFLFNNFFLSLLHTYM